MNTVPTPNEPTVADLLRELADVQRQITRMNAEAEAAEAAHEAKHSRHRYVTGLLAALAVVEYVLLMICVYAVALGVFALASVASGGR